MSGSHLDNALDAFLLDGFAVHEPPYDDFSRDTRPFTERELRQVERALEISRIPAARAMSAERDQRRQMVDAALELVRDRL